MPTRPTSRPISTHPTRRSRKAAPPSDDPDVVLQTLLHQHPWFLSCMHFLTQISAEELLALQKMSILLVGSHTISTREKGQNVVRAGVATCARPSS
jgi:hypothetical protein